MASISTTTLKDAHEPTLGQRIGGAIDYAISFVYTKKEAAQTVAQETKESIYAIPMRVTEATKSVIHSGATQVAKSVKTTCEIAVGTDDDFDTYLKGSEKQPALKRLANAIADFFATFYDKHFSSNGKIARRILASADKDVKSFYSIHYKSFNRLPENDPLKEAVFLAKFIGADHQAVQRFITASVDALTEQVVAEVKPTKPKKNVTFNNEVKVQEFNFNDAPSSITSANAEEEAPAPKKARRRKRAAPRNRRARKPKVATEATNRPAKRAASKQTKARKPKVATVVTDGPARRTRSQTRSVAC
ncbi:MAG: hypothetical protein S4CHLAM37_08180 [Chlamydiia bacterium]|nr:hypothetical protein [Chlamydiia bacterium]